MTTRPSSDDAPFYERPLEGESAHQFMAFMVYRDAGITRPLKKAAEAFYSDGGPGYQEATEGLPESKGGGAPLTRFKEWSRQHSWVARVEAFDLEESRRRSLRMQKQREEMLDRHRNVAMLGEKLASKVIYELLRDEGYYPPSALPALINATTALHRLTLGEATERLETSDANPDQPEMDLSQLSDEEVAALDDLLLKAYGRPPS